MANPVSGIFQTFQEDLGSWLNKGNRKEQLDNVAKNVTGISNVKVKDPALFTRFLQETTPPPPPQPQPQQEPLPPAFGQGGLIDPERARDFALGLAEAGSYALGPAGEAIRNIDIGGQPLYERGKVWEGLIDPQIAMQYGRAVGGPEIPEAMPFVGGMTPLEALAGGAASLTSPGDVALTVGTAGLGPLVSGGARAGRAALAGAGRGGMLRPVGRGGLAVLENITAPIAKGPFSRRLAAEQGISLPVTTALEGTQVRQQEGTAYPWENTATALAGSLIPTIGATTLLPRAIRGLRSRISPDIEVPNILRKQDVDQPFIQESIFPTYATAPTTERSRISISPSVTGEIEQPATRFFPEDVIKEQNRIKELGVTQQNRAFSDLAALNARGAEYIANQNKNLINFAEGFSEIKLSGSVGRYFRDLEPSLDLEIINPKNSDLSIARIVDIADKDFNQEAIILTDKITQADLAQVRAPGGTQRNPLTDIPIGGIIEPGVTRDFSTVYQFRNRITDNDLEAIGKIFDEISPQGGFSVGADFKSIEVFTVRAYNPNYAEESDKIIDIGHLINNYFRGTGGQNATKARPSSIRTRLISRENSPFNQSYSEYKSQNADRIDQLLQKQGIKGAVAPDGSIDFEQLRQGRALTPEQIDEPVRIGPFGERQTNLVMGGSGTDLPEDIFKNLPKNLIDDKEFAFRIQYATDAEKEFLRPFLERANARAKRGEARVLTDKELNFLKNRFLGRTNARMVQDIKPWETGVPQAERKVSSEEIKDFFQNVKMFIPNVIARANFMESFVKLADKIPDLNKLDIRRLRKFFGKDNKMIDAADQIVNDPRASKIKLDTGLWNNSVFLAKAIRGTMDFGAFLRQNIIYTVTRPRATGKAFVQGLKAALSEDAVLKNMEMMESNPNFEKLRDSGMKYNRTGQDIAADQRAEAFMSDFIEKLPTWTGIGPVLRASARFHTHFLNNVRFNVANQMLSPRRLRKYKTQEEIDDLYIQVSKMVNVFTGEGDLTTIPLVGKKKIVRDIMYNTMWAPRLWWSRISLPFYLYKNGKIRNEALKDIAQFIATGYGIMSLVNMDKDTKVDFRKGEIRFKDGTSFKVWGGFEQFINYAVDMLRDYKTSTSGSKYKVGDPNNIVNRWWEQSTKYLRGKANPIVGEIADHVSGFDFFGEDIYDRYTVENWTSLNTKNPFIQSLAPLIITELAELLENTEDPYSRGLGALGIVFGVNVNSYKTKREASLEVYGVDYPELEPFEQRIATLHYYADDTTRSVPDSYKALNDLNNKLKAIPNEKNYTRKNKQQAYYDAKAKASEDRRAVAKEAGFDFDDPFYKDQIRSAGSDIERAALEGYYDLMEEYTTEDGLFLYEQFSKARDKFVRSLNKTEKQYIARNTNLHAETIPKELFKILPRNERLKLQQSINARAEYDRSILKPLDEQIKETFDSLRGKIESQED